jgi:hypothetical protein
MTPMAFLWVLLQVLNFLLNMGKLAPLMVSPIARQVGLM